VRTIVILKKLFVAKVYSEAVEQCLIEFKRAVHEKFNVDIDVTKKNIFISQSPFAIENLKILKINENIEQE